MGAPRRVTGEYLCGAYRKLGIKFIFVETHVLGTLHG